MESNRYNLFTLRNAQAQGRQVRFVYNTKKEGKLVPRIGTVQEVTQTHAVVLDAFHNGSPRSCVLERIVGEVEIDRSF